MFAVLLSYLLALQPFVLKAAAAAERSVDPFAIICSHNGSKPNDQGHHRRNPPCCAGGACCVGTLAFGLAGEAPALDRRVAKPVRSRQIAVALHGFRPTPHDFEARGPPSSV